MFWLSLRPCKSVDGDLQKTSPSVGCIDRVDIIPTLSFSLSDDFSASRAACYYQGSNRLLNAISKSAYVGNVSSCSNSF